MTRCRRCVWTLSLWVQQLKERQGDLEELLGAVQPVDPAYIPRDSQTLPDLAGDSDHPYHLVVV